MGAGPATTDVPNLEGLPKDGAEAQLAQAKLKGDFKEQDSAEDAGTVLRQAPAPGTQLPENAVVTVWVSNGQLKLVPDVIDDTQAQATEKLLKDGFKVRAVFQFRDNVDAGRVFRQNPAQNTEAKVGTQVTIFIARKPEEPSRRALASPERGTDQIPVAHADGHPDDAPAEQEPGLAGQEARWLSDVR